MSTTSRPTPWTRHERPPGSATAGRRARVRNGYWQEWSPEDPEPRTGYVVDLQLPSGKYIVNAHASLHIDASASERSDVDCSLFVGGESRVAYAYPVSPGQGECFAATSHVDASNAVEVQWVCGSSVGPLRLHLAITAIEVDQLHHGG